MRPWLLIPVLFTLAVLAWLWLGGGFDRLMIWAAEGQRSFQNSMARALRALRSGDPGALTALLAVCFAYGFFHAVGPGHGKVLIGGYGMGRRVAMLRLSVLAVVSSLAQGVTAIVLVVGGIALLELGRRELETITEDFFAPASYAAIAAVGLWLVWRGARRLWRTTGHRSLPWRGDRAVVHPEHAQGLAHGHGHGLGHGHKHAKSDHSACAHCGHAHGPTAEEAAAVRGWRDAVMLVGAIAMRPCTGAVFLLILTWRMDILASGIAGTFAMALGTASVTVAVALASVGLREGALAGIGQGAGARLAVPVMELCAGGVVALVAGQLFMRALA
ncbi:MAG: hypothetical protein AAF631_10090 [Pseudomonadota bacterium]